MKKINHQNILKLIEVINDPLSDKLYIGKFLRHLNLRIIINIYE